MNIKILTRCFIPFSIWLHACVFSPSQNKIVSVSNPLNIARKSETISLPVSALGDLVKEFGAENIIIKDSETGEVVLNQPLDNDANGEIDEIIFQTDIAPKGAKKFTVSGEKSGTLAKKTSNIRTYGRFVPERIDDFAWENDKVAFRTYGPVAQQITESGKPGGTLTSGIDCWLKRVDYPVIDKWYKNDLAKISSYHKDTGEGYDPYHVNSSRGCGGIGVWDNGKLHVSKNFTGYKIIENGPIRTVFELVYAPWDANGITINEKKRISIDLGSNLTRYEIDLKTNKPLPNVVVGITQHEKKGQANADVKAGWFRYWEPIDDSELGTGIVVNPAVVYDYKNYQVAAKDESHVFAFTNPVNNKLIYYAGFGWSKSGQFDTPDAWDNYLQDFAKRLATPLQVKISG